MAKKSSSNSSKKSVKSTTPKTVKNSTKKTTKSSPKKRVTNKPKKTVTTKAKGNPKKTVKTTPKKVVKKSVEKVVQNKIAVKSYMKSKQQSPETLSKLYKITHSHPSKREYLSTRDFNKAFAVDKKEVDNFIAFAKEKSWEVAYDKKTRELQISIPEDSGLVDNTDSKDISLSANKNTDDSENQSAHKGFVNSAKEARVSKGKKTEIEDESHGLSVLKVAQAYNFPEGDGEGQTIGIIELGGGASTSDIKNFFAHYNVATPKIQVKGRPSKLTIKDDIEVTSDIQVAGLIAPKAKFVVYYGDSILEAMKSALSDTRNKLSIISISWAGSEFGYSSTELEELNQVFYEAAVKGITVLAASGDTGAFNGKHFPNVNVPAIFYHVLGCGGTEMHSYGDVISAETVWNETTAKQQAATGGGFSTKVSLPRYQQRATEQYLSQHPEFQIYDRQKGRGVPDISANASEASGYSILFGGKWLKVGGTSLATPLWAGLIARINQNLGYNLGFINAQLYELMGTEAFHPIAHGNNNLYVGALDWNACTGLGTPNGQKLQEAIDSLKDS